MSTPDQLLGGHATGTLTQEERARLYGAALQDQRLFDALMDEEALRELLADPEARAQLLRALAPAKPVPLYRRPWMLGVAASLLVGLITTWNVVRQPQETRMPPSPAKAAAPTSPPAPASAPPQALRKGIPAPLSAPRPAEARLGAQKDEAKPAPVKKVELEINLAQEAASGVAPAPAAPPLASRAEEARSEKADHRAKAFAASAGAVAEGAAMSPAPRWELEPADLGRTRLRLTLPRPGHAYLLRRSAEGVTVVPGEGTGLVRTWLLTATPGTHWDLYVLDRPAERPQELPETGKLPGWHQRIVIPNR